MSLELLLGMAGAISACIVPFVLHSMSKQSERLKTMEDRIFNMNRESVSKSELKEELNQLEGRVSHSISEKWESVRSEISSLKELMILMLKQKE